MKFTQKEREKAVEAARLCLDGAIDLQDLGFGCGDTNQIINLARHLESEIEDKEFGIFKD